MAPGERGRRSRGGGGREAVLNNVPLRSQEPIEGRALGRGAAWTHLLGSVLGNTEGKTRAKARRPVRRPFAVSSKGCWWFGPEGALRGGEILSDTRFFFFNWETTAFPDCSCEGFGRSPLWSQRLRPQQLEEWGFFKWSGTCLGEHIGSVGMSVGVQLLVWKSLPKRGHRLGPTYSETFPSTQVGRQSICICENN